MPRGRGENDLGPMNVRLDGANRTVDDQPDADGRREVENHIARVDQPSDLLLVTDRVDGQVKSRIAGKVIDVGKAARGQIVENEDFVTSGNADVGQMRPYETSPAGDENPHPIYPYRPSVPLLTTALEAMIPPTGYDRVRGAIVTGKLLSIITPVFHAGEKIAATLTSVRNQDSSLFEHHVVDGGSVDGTLEVVRREAPDADLISEPDEGIYDAINKGIARSQGRFVYVLGAGDVLRPGVLAKLADRLEKMPPNSVVYGNVYWVGQNCVYDGAFSKRDLTTHCICHQAMFIDRSVFEILGTYDLRYPISSDWHFNIRCFSDPRIVVQYVDEIVADYEGGGISDTGYDGAFQSDLPDLIRRSFGIRCLLILWRYRLFRRLLGIRLAVQSRLRRMVRRRLQR